MKLVVEQCSPYRPYTMGEILKSEDGENRMIKFPKLHSDMAEKMLKDAKTFLNFHHDRVAFHGIRYGRGMKTILVPKFSTGTLITWAEGHTGIAVTEHNTDSIIHIKELFSTNIGKLCHLYLFGFVQMHTEDSWIPARVSRGYPAQDQQAPMDQKLCLLLPPQVANIQILLLRSSTRSVRAQWRLWRRLLRGRRQSSI
jgi:hypothetical protein